MVLRTIKILANSSLSFILHNVKYGVIMFSLSFVSFFLAKNDIVILFLSLRPGL